jgi:hypothetical protein
MGREGYQIDEQTLNIEGSAVATSEPSDEVNWDDLEELLRQTEPWEKQKKELQRRANLKRMDPDWLWRYDSQRSLTFMYKDGKLIGERNIAHHQLSTKHNWLSHINSSDREHMLTAGYVLGRIGPAEGTTVVIFWNRTENNPVVKDCVHKLIENGWVRPEYYIVGDWSEVQTIAEYVGEEKPKYPGIKSEPYGPEQLRKIHISPPQVKKQLMAQQGYKPPMKDTPRPGVKWWAPTSEGLNFRDFIKVQASS